MVVNATYKIAPWADVCYGADYRFWSTYRRDILARFRGELWSVSEQARDAFGLYWIRHSAAPGLSTESDMICGGGNSGYQAIGLAALFGARRILLLGFDMQRTGGQAHWHGKHEGGLPNGAGFPNWMRAFAPLARDLRAAGIETLNCTRQTALRCFTRMPLENALCAHTCAAPERPIAPPVPEKVMCLTA